MKRETKKWLLWFLAAFALFLVIGGGIWIRRWIDEQQSVAKELAAVDRLANLIQTVATLQQGSTPEAWPVRAFVPAATFSSILSKLEGSQILIPIGKVDADGKVDGYVRIDVKQASSEAVDTGLRANLSTVAKYEPERAHKEWSSIAIDLDIKAFLLPVAQEKEKDSDLQITTFQVVPDEVRVGTGWWVIRLETRAFVSTLLADLATIKIGKDLSFTVPSVVSDLELDPTFNSSTEEKFGGQGSTQLVSQLTRPVVKQSLVMDKFIVSKSGVWLLGGKNTQPVPRATVDPKTASVELEKRIPELLKLLTPFERTDGIVEAVIPSSAIVNFAKSALAAPAFLIGLTTKDTTPGAQITSALLVHDDPVLRDVGFDLKPVSDPFGKGGITITPGDPSWNKDGLHVPLKLDASVNAQASLEVHSGFGINASAPVTVVANGTVADGKLDASFRQVSVDGKNAVVFDAVAQCTSIKINTLPIAAPKLPVDWLSISPISIGIDTRLGRRMSPSVLVGPTPVLAHLPERKDEKGNPMTRNPKGTIVIFKHPYLQFQFEPSSTTMTDSQVSVKASAVVGARDGGLTDAEMNARKTFAGHVADATVPLDCPANTSFALVSGEAKILDVNKEWNYFRQSVAGDINIAKSTGKLLIETNPAHLPEDLQGVADAVKSKSDAEIQHAIQKVKDTQAAATALAEKLKDKAQKKLDDAAHGKIDPKDVILPGSSLFH